MQPTMLSGMERKSFEDMSCSVAQCLEVIGEWWTMLIVRDAFLGVRRFDEFQARLGIARNVLTQRLSKLVDAAVLQRRPYQDKPPRYEYVLTAKGYDLWPVLNAMRQWGDRHAAPAGPPVTVVHRKCGHSAPLELSCTHCGERVTHRDVQAKQGPGAKRALPRSGVQGSPIDDRFEHRVDVAVVVGRAPREQSVAQ
jgi:DNA-binding HxlR family transcriptional regulator